MKKKLVSAMLVLSMCSSLVACGNSGANDDVVGTEAGTESASATDGSGESEISMPDGYDATSSSIYNEQLGDFYTAYQTALEAEDIDERFALEAIAEAKLLESAVMVPTQTKGGGYAVSRVVPYTAPNVLWGNDYERYHNTLVVDSDKFITSADRDAIKAKYKELKGTGTYTEWVKGYLADQGYTLKDSYALTYVSDPVTWDALNTSLAADSEAIINTYDGLMEYDNEGELQPALAESYEVSDDGLTYTFHIRKGVSWVDSQGREVADVTADDFVAGMQHMMDCQAGLEYLVQGVIVGADAYISGETSDFSEVGVKAVDDYTLEYTLEQPTSYFMTMLGYGVFAPMSRSYYESQGGKFGVEFDSSASDYTYGKDPNSIAYCGPYLVTSSTEKNSIVFELNESYWNAANVANKKITWVYNDGSDATKAYNDAVAGTVDGSGLTTSALELAKKDGNFDEYAYVSATDATSFSAFVNLNRNAFYNFNDSSKAVSTESAEEQARTNQAVQNVHFRRALAMSFDRGQYNAVTYGEDLKYNALRNSYTPGNFVSLSKDVTVSINGEDVTFPAGTNYGEIVQAQIDADGVKVTVFDKDSTNEQQSDGFDGWYNVDNAREEMAQAIDELKAEGLEITAENPIQLDLPYPSSDEIYTNRANVYKQSLEEGLEGLVQVNLVDCNDSTTWYYTGYYTSYGYENNYDLFDLSGWGPDYGDPQTYLDTFLPDYAGYVTKTLGVF
ncbi:MAG: peptide ABC transporter substrate-binding protein [Lachnobacterium sp.]|nr:peptide ABC transporter substrate-binding protein [Lachnobacterium sp.]MDY2912262.1 peptide ABC transporter substrate-binding protein [Agathobacter sp.]